jgi:cysteine synthase A
MRTGSVWDLIGQTPLVYIRSLSELTGCKIYGKAEFMNPGGSVKDRAAKGIIADAEKRGVLKRGGTIVEGTAGNTGIGLATLAADRGYKTIIVMPDNQSAEKYQTLEALGAEVRRVPAVPFSNLNHFYHTARVIAEGLEGGFWANQFENSANGEFHFATTGPEIWEQTERRVTDFVCAIGTGGTMSGVSRYLKQVNSGVRVMAADPAGSGIYTQIKEGKLVATGSSVTEGIGIMRLTSNFLSAKIDDAMQVSDQEMIDMIYHLSQNDGLVLGTSSGINAMAAYRIGQMNAGSGRVIVTVLCDSGSRYASRTMNDEWLREKNLLPKKLTQTIT